MPSPVERRVAGRGVVRVGDRPVARADTEQRVMRAMRSVLLVLDEPPMAAALR